MKKRISNRALWAVLLTLCFLALPASIVHAVSGTGHIFGQLLNGSNKNAPVAGQGVILQTLQGSNANDFATSTTDEHGNFSFDNLPTDKTTSYALYIRYQGAQYGSDLLTLDSKPAQQVDLTVYDATASSANIAVISSNVLVHEANTQTGSLTISEVLDFQNLDNHAFVGSLDASKGKPNALFFSLPANVRSGSITLDKGFAGYHVVQVDHGFAADAALLPGSNEFTFSYEVPYTGSSYALSYTPNYPTVLLSVLVPPSMEVNASALQAGGVVNAQQHPYRLFKAEKLSAKQVVQIGLAGLPEPQAAASPRPLSTNLLWLIVAIVGMCAILAATWWFYRSQRLKVSRGQAAHLPVNKLATPLKASTGTDRQQALLQALLDLDKQFEDGKLDKASYEERRTRTRARLRTIMSEQEPTRR